MATQIGDPNIDDIAEAILKHCNDTRKPLAAEIAHVYADIRLLSVLLDIGEDRLAHYNDVLSVWPSSRTFIMFSHVIARMRYLVARNHSGYRIQMDRLAGNSNSCDVRTSSSTSHSRWQSLPCAPAGTEVFSRSVTFD